MPFRNEITFTATLMKDVEVKPDRFHPEKTVVWNFVLAIDEQPLPKGNKESDLGTCKWVYATKEVPKDFVVPSTLCSGAKVLFRGRMLGKPGKDLTLPKGYYITINDFRVCSQKSLSVNSFISEATVYAAKHCNNLEGTTRILLKEPKQSFGTVKPDLSKMTGYHYYFGVINTLVDLEKYKPDSKFLFVGRLAKNIYSVDRDHPSAKKLSQPLILIDRAMA